MGHRKPLLAVRTFAAVHRAAYRVVHHASRHCWHVAGGLCWLTGQAHAAGGHHAVDDAAILEPGQCEVETWIDRERHGPRSLVHVGPACRVGPVELGFNVDRTQLSGQGAATAAGPQVKWAYPLTESLGVGVVVAANGRDRTPRALTGVLVFPLTWQATDTVALHLNLGKDFRRGDEPDTRRSGAALEWAALPAWSFVAERFRESDTNHWRVGARHVLSEGLTVDLSRAQASQRRVPTWWTVGVTWAFDR
ncbi:MAG: hypothetical protein EOO32_04190 [Comamonadaceae bacterium]|nr:MAG: hypothetical protein EOO32_04190 [Comamonadaceae bacterium]